MNIRKQSNYLKSCSSMIRSFLTICFSIFFGTGSFCLAEITDTFANTTYLTAALNSAVSANGTANMTITGSGDSVVNWRQGYHIRLRNYNDRVEVDPAAAIGS